MLLFALLACPAASTSKGDTADAEAWPEWEESADDSGLAGTDSGADSALPEDEGVYDACEPDSCIELAEAVDRGFATIEYGSWGMQVRNDGPYEICFERWYTFLSTQSQDAVAGTTDASLVVETDSHLVIPYADWGVDTEAWWCVEHNQYTAAGASYTFNGSRAPTKVAGWTNDASDVDADSVEDHSDIDAMDGLPQTQHSVWDYIDDEPVFIVGRQTNWFEVANGETLRVVVQVTNLGRRSGSATVVEKVPAGWSVSTVSPAPLSRTTDSDGAELITWEVELRGGIEPSDPYQPTDYDEVGLEYRLTYTGGCSGREVGYAPNVRWSGGSGAFVSEGAPLVLECCGGDDGPLGGGGVGGLP